jgi:hypothetical protein
LDTSLRGYREKLAQAVAAGEQKSFMQVVARYWRLQQALINGHSSFGQQAQEATLAFESLIAHDCQHRQMAEALLDLLNAACRTSSMIEGVNKLLKQFLHNHQAFRRPETLQLYLNHAGILIDTLVSNTSEIEKVQGAETALHPENELLLVQTDSVLYRLAA